MPGKEVNIGGLLLLKLTSLGLLSWEHIREELSEGEDSPISKGSKRRLSEHEFTGILQSTDCAQVGFSP